MVKVVVTYERNDLQFDVGYQFDKMSYALSFIELLNNSVVSTAIQLITIICSNDRKEG